VSSAGSIAAAGEKTDFLRSPSVTVTSLPFIRRPFKLVICKVIFRNLKLGGYRQMIGGGGGVKHMTVCHIVSSVVSRN